MDKHISIARDFSRTPAGRFKADGPKSGEAFREDLLYPALKEADSVEVDLDGALGYGSSFLEEAFGGLVREKNMSAEELAAKLKIKSTHENYEGRIWRYIRDAEAHYPRALKKPR